MENVDHIVIEQLKAVRSDIAGMRSEMHIEFKDVKARLNHLDASMAGVRRDGACRLKILLGNRSALIRSLTVFSELRSALNS